MDKKCIVLFSGFNQRAITAFIRTLEKHNLDYGIIATSKNDFIFDTAYKDKVIIIRQHITLDLEDVLNAIHCFRQKVIADEYVLAPSTEALNRFLLDNRTLIENETVKIPLVSKQLYEKISDKYSFGQVCVENNIKLPTEYSTIENCLIPFVAKPIKYFSVDGSVSNPYLILTEHDKQKFLTEKCSADFYYQEFIHGKSFYLLYYFHSNGCVFKYSQENFIQQPEGKSIVAAVTSSVHFSDESIKYEELFKKLNFIGLVMVEIKQQNDIFYMIEANPRFWGPSQLFVDAEMNFFDAFLHDLGFLENLPSFVEPIDTFRYFWFGGIVKAYRLKKQLKYYFSDESVVIKDLPIWLEADVYRRPDTQNIFKNELI